MNLLKTIAAKEYPFFQLELIILALSALTLTFIAIKKIFLYSGLDVTSNISSNTVILIVLSLTLISAVFGGIKTSIISGFAQGVLWLVFSAILLLSIITNDNFSFQKITGVRELDNFFDIDFLKSFGIFTAISLTVGATSHGSLWMKTYSGKYTDQHKSYYIAAIIFGIIIISISLASLGYVSVDGGLKDVQTSIVKSVQFFGGKYLLMFFILLVLMHSSSLIDAYCNFCSNAVTVDNDLSKKNILKTKIFTVVFIFLSYLIFLSGISIWMVFGIMSIARIVNFYPLINICNSKKVNEPIIFYTILICMVICFSLFVYGKSMKINDFVMWSGIVAMISPYIAIKLLQKKILKFKSF